MKKEVLNNVFIVRWAMEPNNLLNEESLTEFSSFIDEFSR